MYSRYTCLIVDRLWAVVLVLALQRVNIFVSESRILRQSAAAKRCSYQWYNSRPSQIALIEHSVDMLYVSSLLCYHSPHKSLLVSFSPLTSPYKSSRFSGAPENTMLFPAS